MARPTVVSYVDPLLKNSSEKLPVNGTVRPKKAKKIIKRQSENDGDGKKMEKIQKPWGMHLPHLVEPMIPSQ